MTVRSYSRHTGQAYLSAASSIRYQAIVAATPICRGFAVGRSIFGAAARDWFAGSLDDDTAVATIAENYSRLIGAWRTARGAVA